MGISGTRLVLPSIILHAQLIRFDLLLQLHTVCVAQADAPCAHTLPRFFARLFAGKGCSQMYPIPRDAVDGTDDVAPAHAHPLNRIWALHCDSIPSRSWQTCRGWWSRFVTIRTT